MNIDKLDSDDALERGAVQRRQLPISVFDDSASMDRDQRRTNRRRLGVGQTERRLFGGDLSSEEDNSIGVGNDVRHFLDQKYCGFPRKKLKNVFSFGCLF